MAVRISKAIGRMDTSSRPPLVRDGLVSGHAAKFVMVNEPKAFNGPNVESGHSEPIDIFTELLF